MLTINLTQIKFWSKIQTLNTVLNIGKKSQQSEKSYGYLRMSE